MTNDKFATDIKAKANIFNNFFADQCPIVRNNSELPTTFTKKHVNPYHQ